MGEKYDLPVVTAFAVLQYFCECHMLVNFGTIITIWSAGSHIRTDSVNKCLEDQQCLCVSICGCLPALDHDISLLLLHCAR